MTRAWAPVLALVLALAPGVVSAAVPVLHYPPDRLVVAGTGTLHVVGEAEAPAQMDVTLNGVAAPPAVARAAERRTPILHSTLRLAPGVNTIEVSFRTGGAATTTMRREVYFFARLARADVPPAAFARQPFHGGPPAAACAGCHELTARPDDAQPLAPAQSTCFSCHSGLTRAREVHGPTALWACTRCHDARGAAGRYATPDPVMPLCFSCHDEQKTRFYGSRFQHGPTATGLCTICHDPHGTENQFFLKKAPWDLCTTCHAEKGSGRHVISWGPNGQGHPTRGRPDPNRPGRELSCASCHNPHAAPGPRLWNFNAVMWLDLCRNCHRTLMGK